MTLWLDMIGAEIRMIETKSFGETRIAEAGREHDNVIIFMHGIGGHLEAYSKNIVALSDDFHTIAFDFVGHGKSNRLVTDYSPAMLVQHLAELMDAMNIPKVNLSGESLGGWVAGLFAGEYPERVERLMLNTAAGLPILTEKGQQDLKNLVELSQKAATQGPPTYESVHNRMKWLFHVNNHPMISDELINTRLHFYSQPGMREVAPRVLAMIGQHDEFLIPLEKLGCETLFLWTEDNPVHDVETARLSAEKVANAQLYVMKADAAHWPQYEAVEEFNRVTREFFL